MKNRIYKVLLVDDEKVVLDYIQKVVCWEETGFEICGIAESGDVACQMIQKLHPDLVITDIMMPQMNGIELAEYIQENAQDTEIIIISGYDDFEYARSAIRLGVSEYILKPTDPKELIETLKKVYLKIQNREELEDHIRKYKKERELNIPILKNSCFSDLASNKINESEEKIREILKDYHSDLTGGKYMLMCFDLDHSQDDEIDICMRELLWMQLKVMLREKFKNEYRYDSFVQEKYLYVLIEDAEISENSITLDEILGYLLVDFRRLTKNSVSVGISREHAEYTDLYQAKCECNVALEKRCVMGNGSCIFFDDINRTSESEMLCNYELISQVVLKMQALNVTGTIELIDLIYEQQKEKNVTWGMIYSQTMLFLSQFYSICEQEK